MYLYSLSLYIYIYVCVGNRQFEHINVFVAEFTSSNIQIYAFHAAHVQCAALAARAEHVPEAWNNIRVQLGVITLLLAL